MYVVPKLNVPASCVKAGVHMIAQFNLLSFKQRPTL